MLVSPTEPKMLRELGSTSPVPESYGADFLWPSSVWGLVGVQRKELSDFVASVMDGRLAMEIAQMQQLGLKLLVLEGNESWTNDGYAMWTRTRWSRSQHLGKLWSIQSDGCWIATTQGVTDTSILLSLFTRWTAKQRHTGSTRTRPTGDEWGKSGNREWAIHLLQGFKGIGPKQAEAIYEWFDGVPISWDVEVHDLMEVDGIGLKRAEALIEALDDG